MNRHGAVLFQDHNEIRAGDLFEYYGYHLEAKTNTTIQYLAYSTAQNQTQNLQS